MNKTLFEELDPLIPVDFFNIEVEGTIGKEFSLPDTSDLLGESSFADFSMKLTKEALKLKVDIRKPFEESLYPEYEKGDSLELFIDTRDLKTAGFMTRFCHQFLILPVEVQGITSREITRFRTEDVHPLCDPADLEVKAHFHSGRYSLEIEIPEHCLHGYDPASFSRLGFTYRVNRPEGNPQHFSLSSRLYNIVQHPSLWATIDFS